MNTIVMWIFSKTRIGQMLDGKKRIIGAVLTALSAVLWTLEHVAPMFPEYAFLGQAAAALNAFFPQAEQALAAVGLTSLTIGLVHADAKKKATN